MDEEEQAMKPARKCETCGGPIEKNRGKHTRHCAPCIWRARDLDKVTRGLVGAAREQAERQFLKLTD